MSFISYAQNYEDVMLHRALASVSQGFYVDVGAAWPEEHSVTKAFYDLGWSGINIEPNPKFYAELAKERPRDINLQIAIGDRRGEVVMNIIDDTGLSSADEQIAQGHREAGWNLERQTVDMERLADLLERQLPAGQEIHFLKVDVEGYEEQALRSNDWRKFRPWVVVVEATLPMSQTPSYEQWEPLLLDADYEFVYADGLNRFYVAKEHAALREAFAFPPNVFDGFKSADLWRQEQLNAALHDELQTLKYGKGVENAAREVRWQQHMEKLTSQHQQHLKALRAEHMQALDTLRAEIEAAHADAQAWREQAQAAHQYNHDILHSTAWRMTAPLRWGLDKMRQRVTPAQKRAIKLQLERAARWVNRHPRLKRQVMSVLNRFPRLRARLARVVNQSFVAAAANDVTLDAAAGNLTPRARQVLVDLKVAMRRTKGGA